MIGGRSKRYDGINIPSIYDSKFKGVVKRKAFHELLQAKGLTITSLARNIGTTPQNIYRHIKKGVGGSVWQIEKVIGLPIETISRLYNNNDLKEINNDN